MSQKIKQNEKFTNIFINYSFELFSVMQLYMQAFQFNKTATGTYKVFHVYQ